MVRRFVSGLLKVTLLPLVILCASPSLGADEFAAVLVSPDVVKTIDLSSTFALDKFKAPAPLLGVAAAARDSSVLIESEAIPMSDAAWFFVMGLVGFVVLSNRRSA